EAARARPGKSLRMESALRLRQIHEVARQAFLGKHALNHVAVTSCASQSILYDGSAARRLKEIEEGKYGIGKRQRHIVHHGLQFALRICLQTGVAGSCWNFFSREGGDRVDLIEWRGLALLCGGRCLPGLVRFGLRRSVLQRRY